MTESAEAESRVVETADVETSQSANGVTPTRERSTIRFPYTDLRDAVTVAKAIKEHWGSTCATDDLAAVFGQKPSSGSFRTKVATASIFGVVDVQRGSLTLTQLGHDVADGRPDAFARAFLQVPLYERLYRDYRGKDLPGDAGLEKEIRELGVVPSQADRARQALMRSADIAGFFWTGRNRLVQPANGTIGASGESSNNEPGPGDQAGKRREAEKLSDAPLLRALWDTLPEDKPFSAEQRRKFFTALAINIDYVYGEPTDGELDPERVANLWRVKGKEPSGTAREAD